MKKRSIYKLRTVLLRGVGLLCMLLCVACEDDGYVKEKPVIEYSDFVTFGSSLPNGWNSLTNSNDSSLRTKTLQMGKTTEGIPLLMTMSVARGIEKEKVTCDSVSTRAGSISAEDNLGVFSYIVNAGDVTIEDGNTEPAYEAAKATQFMRDNLVKVGESYAYEPVKYWPGDDYWLKFFAYSPYKDNVKVGSTSYLTVSDEGNIPQLNYTVPENVDDQVDLMAAYREMIKGDFRKTVNLPFRHLLSAVQFKVGTMPNAVIESIGLTGVKNSATYRMIENPKSTDPTIFDKIGMEYNNTGSAIGNFTQTFTENNSAMDFFTKGQIGKTFYMVPQTFEGESAKIAMKLGFVKNVNGVEKINKYDLESPISAFTKTWNADHTYTYTLSTPSEVKISINDKVSEDGKVKSDLEIKNIGIATVYIRVTIIGEWVRFNPDSTFAVVSDWDRDVTDDGFEDGVFLWGEGNGGAEPTETATTGWRKNTEEDQSVYYYYLAPVERNTTIPIPLFEKYTLTANAPVADAELLLIIAAQAVIIDDLKTNIGSDPANPEYIWPNEIVDILVPDPAP